MGLTREGFTPEQYADIKARISARLSAFSPGIDLSSESPDGQLVDIISFELGQVWNELNLVYNSYNPNQATGAGLKNLGLISGLVYGSATRSQVDVVLGGTAGTTIPKGALVADANGNEFATSLEATIPATVQVVANLSGPIPVDIGAITTIVTQIDGWSTVSNPSPGRKGAEAQSELEFRNLRNKTVLRNFKSVGEVVVARLYEDLGIDQVSIIDNDDPSNALNGVPPQTIQVTVGEVPEGITDEMIGTSILLSKGLGCPTHGTTSVVVKDPQGVLHTVRFSKATPVTIWMDIEILFLDENFAGLEDKIRTDLVAHINSLATGEDVIWSRLFGIITPYGKAQVNALNISRDNVTYSPANIVVGESEFASAELGNINIRVVN